MDYGGLQSLLWTLTLVRWEWVEGGAGEDPEPLVVATLGPKASGTAE